MIRTVSAQIQCLEIQVPVNLEFDVHLVHGVHDGGKHIDQETTNKKVRKGAFLSGSAVCQEEQFLKQSVCGLKILIFQEVSQALQLIIRIGMRGGSMAEIWL